VAFERIRRYPISRRPSRIAANIVLDTRQAITRRLAREAALQVVVGTPGDTGELIRLPARTEKSAGEELLRLINDAVRSGHITEDAARVIVLTRVHDVTVADLAMSRSEDVRTVRQRRRRAELSLAASISSAVA